MAGSRKTLVRLRSEDGFGIVEALIALTILVIGVLAVSGLTLASAAQARIANWRSDQAIAAQVAFEQLRLDGFDAAASGVDTVNIAGHDYIVSLTVTTVSARVKDVSAQVAGVGDLGARTFNTRLYAPRALPPPPSGP